MTTNPQTLRDQLDFDPTMLPDLVDAPDVEPEPEPTSHDDSDQVGAVEVELEADV